MPEDKLIYAIMINYCHPKVTLECVDSLLKSEDVTLKIIVVDNASPDNSANFLSDALPEDVILLKASENKGFSAGNNIGIKYAVEHGADYILLINNDTVVAPDMVKLLANKTDINTVTAPKMYYYSDKNKVWFAGGKYLPLTGKFVHIGEGGEDIYNSDIECDWLTGCCLMFSAKVIEKVGYLDETFFMYSEDVDYSIRLRNNKLKLKMINDAHLWHKVGASSGVASRFVLYYSNRNRLYLQKKIKEKIYIRLLTIITRFLLVIKGLIFNTNEKYIWYSIVDFFKNRMGEQNRV